MRPEYKPLKELTSKVKKYKTKVKVVHKGYPHRSPKKPETRYQRIVFEDEEGFSMKGALFNNGIERYAEALQRKGEYELDDVTVKLVPGPYAGRPNEHSLVINDRVKINPLIADPETLAPEYQAISTIPRDPFDNNLFDVLGIILYVCEPKAVENSTGHKDTVQEVHIIDHRAVKHSTRKENIITVEALNQKKAHSTLQDELFTIRVTFPTAAIDQMYVYVGCSKCSRRCDAELGTKFSCQHCCAPEAVGDPRIVLKMDAVDATDTIQLPIFAQNIKQLLGLTTLQLWTLSKNDVEAIAAAMHVMRSKRFLVKVGPTLALTTSQVLSWAVRAIQEEAPPSAEIAAAVPESADKAPETAQNTPPTIAVLTSPITTPADPTKSPVTPSNYENED